MQWTCRPPVSAAPVVVVIVIADVETADMYTPPAAVVDDVAVTTQLGVSANASANVAVHVVGEPVPGVMMNPNDPPTTPGLVPHDEIVGLFAALDVVTE